MAIEVVGVEIEVIVVFEIVDVVRTVVVGIKVEDVSPVFWVVVVSMASGLSRSTQPIVDRSMIKVTRINFLTTRPSRF